MARSNAQRIGIIIMAAVMAIGTIGSFFIVIVANENQQIDARQNEEMEAEMAAYQEKYQKYQEAINKEAEEIAPKYYDLVKSYEKHPSSFDASKVSELGKKDIKNGDGAEVKEASEMRAYYIGWNEKGDIFESSINGDTLNPPVPVENTIQGWQEGVIGMKMGGVRELTIPADMAYGEKDSELTDEENKTRGVLKFLVFALPVSDIKEPEVPEALLQMMGQGV